jgi:hypothetical protein
MTIIVYVGTLLIIGLIHQVNSNLYNNSIFSFINGFIFVYAQNNDFDLGDISRGDNDSNFDLTSEPEPEPTPDGGRNTERDETE